MFRGSHFRRRSRHAFGRWTRLGISALVLVLLIVGIVLLVRGCSKGAPDKAAPQAAATEVPEVSPQAQSPEETSEPEPAQTPKPQAQVAPEVEGASLPFGGRSAVIRSIGDIVMHVPLLRGAYDGSGKTYDFSPYIADIAPSIAAADYTILNVDGPMGGKKFGAYKGYPQFNTPPQLLLALKDAGVDMLTLANNHALDTYFDGLVATLDNVDKAGLDHVGTYRTQEERDKPFVKVIGGIRVGFANYTVSINNMAKRSDEAARTFGLAMTSNSNAPGDIARLREAGAEVVIVVMHWGKEYERAVSKGLHNIAAKLIAAGADVVIGGHQHVVLPAETLTTQAEDKSERTGLVFYGMGNFLSDQREQYKDWGVIAEITLRDNPQTGKVEVVDPHYIPTYVERTKGKKTYSYRVLPVGDILENAPTSVTTDVLARLRQIAKEHQEVFKNSPATPLNK